MSNFSTRSNQISLDERLRKLRTAMRNRRSQDYCLALWSRFIRQRDGGRCVDCHSSKKLSAHHICRKSFVSEAKFLTGNGITLCADCHKALHQGFNARPNLLLPVDAQGGEKLQSMARLYCILFQDSIERQIANQAYYFLSEPMLWTLKRLQGYSEKSTFPGPAIWQAYLILGACELPVRNALMEANGFSADDHPISPGCMQIAFY